MRGAGSECRAIRGALAHDITMLFAPPDILTEIVHEAIVPPGRQDTFTICVAGGFLSARLAQQIRRSITRRIKYNYGATECVDILRSDVENEDELHWLSPLAADRADPEARRQRL